MRRRRRTKTRRTRRRVENESGGRRRGTKEGRLEMRNKKYRIRGQWQRRNGGWRMTREEIKKKEEEE